MATSEHPGKDAKRRAALGALDGVVRTAEDLLGRSVKLAPLREGELRGSAAIVYIVNGRRFEGDNSLEAARSAVLAAVDVGGVHIDAEVSFNTVYAARQHEELTWQHDEGQAKYLEQPLREQARRYERIIALSSERGSD